jgi:hypothetical protein
MLFGVDAARTNVAPTGLSAGQVGRLSERRVALDGTVDSSPAFVAGTTVRGRTRDVLVVTTTYGRTEALDAATGAVLWRFQPRSYDQLKGTTQFTTTSPAVDPGRRAVYAASPDGLVHKLALVDGHEVRGGAWPVRVTRDPGHEKLAAALNLDGAWVYAVTGGYLGDAPPYQGKVVAIERATGRIAGVTNLLCADRPAIIVPSSCPSSDAAIWGRAGAVVDPRTHAVYVTTGNGPFNGRTDFGDSVVEVGAGASGVRRHFTPASQAQLEAADADLGSAAPAILGPSLLLQGGKDSRLRLLDTRRSLHPVGAPTLGGEVQTLPLQGSSVLVSAIAVLRSHGRTLAFVGTDGALTAYRLAGDRLRQVWTVAHGATSPVVAGGLLYAYDPAGALRVLRPASGRVVRELPAPPGHWNSPIVAGGRVYLPSGDANDHATRGTLSIYTPR